MNDIYLTISLLSPTGGGRSVGIVRVRTKATEFVLVFSTHNGDDTPQNNAACLPDPGVTCRKMSHMHRAASYLPGRNSYRLWLHIATGLVLTADENLTGTVVVCYRETLRV